MWEEGMGKHLPGGIREGVPPERRDWFQEMSGVFKFSLSSLSEQDGGPPRPAAPHFPTLRPPGVPGDGGPPRPAAPHFPTLRPPWWFSNQL